MVERTVTEPPVLRLYAPPALVLLHPLQLQMPTAERFMPYLPQKSQKNLSAGTPCFLRPYGGTHRSACRTCQRCLCDAKNDTYYGQYISRFGFIASRSPRLASAPIRAVRESKP